VLGGVIGFQSSGYWYEKEQLALMVNIRMAVKHKVQCFLFLCTQSIKKALFK
jgi:hypothetical protein